jgi:hypothetical protein
MEFGLFGNNTPLTYSHHHGTISTVSVYTVKLVKVLPHAYHVPTLPGASTRGHPEFTKGGGGMDPGSTRPAMWVLYCRRFRHIKHILCRPIAHWAGTRGQNFSLPRSNVSLLRSYLKPVLLNSVPQPIGLKVYVVKENKCIITRF